MPINNKVDEIIEEAEKGPVEFKVYFVECQHLLSQEKSPVPNFARNLFLETLGRATEALEAGDKSGLSAASFLGLDAWGDGMGIIAFPGDQVELEHLTRTARKVFKAFGVKRFARVVSATVRKTGEDGTEEEGDMLVLSFVDPPNKPQVCLFPVDGEWPGFDELVPLEVEEDSGYVNFMKPQFDSRVIRPISPTIH